MVFNTTSKYDQHHFRKTLERSSYSYFMGIAHARADIAKPKLIARIQADIAAAKSEITKANLALASPELVAETNAANLV